MSSVTEVSAPTPFEAASWTLLLVPVTLCVLLVMFLLITDTAEPTTPATDEPVACRNTVDYQPRFCQD